MSLYIISETLSRSKRSDHHKGDEYLTCIEERKVGRGVRGENALQEDARAFY